MGHKTGIYGWMDGYEEIIIYYEEKGKRKTKKCSPEEAAKFLHKIKSNPKIIWKEIRGLKRKAPSIT